VKIFKQYGESAIAQVTENPYQLAEDIFGIGFLTADKIARLLGVSPWSKYRYQSGIKHVLSTGADDGHCFLPQPELIELTAQQLTNDSHEADSQAVGAIIEEMGQQKELIVEPSEGGMPLSHIPHFTLKYKKLQVFSKKKNQNNQKKYSTNQMLRRNHKIQNIFSAQRVKLSHNNSRSSDVSVQGVTRE
jgi:exodeoxyribonuclease V alpha subunit